MKYTWTAVGVTQSFCFHDSKTAYAAWACPFPVGFPSTTDLTAAAPRSPV